MTRAREKLYLVGSINKRDETITGWQEASQELEDTLLPASLTGSAKCYLDWVGPAYYRHSDLNPHSSYEDIDNAHFSSLQVSDSNSQVPAPPVATVELAAIADLRSLPDHGYGEKLRQRFGWTYAAQGATIAPAKMSVSELKRKLAIEIDADAATYLSSTPQRPSFARSRQGLTAVETDTAMHTLMQHVDLGQPVSLNSLVELRTQMLQRNLLTVAESEAIDLNRIYQFFAGDLGQRLLKSPQVWRELPFGLRIPANEIHPAVVGEYHYIQGVIDCLFEDGDGVVLVDFKNDKVSAEGLAAAADRYRVQIDLYARAIRELLKREVREAYLYLFAAGVPMRVELDPIKL